MCETGFVRHLCFALAGLFKFRAFDPGLRAVALNPGLISGGLSGRMDIQKL